jgi:hypothetical protein
MLISGDYRLDLTFRLLIKQIINSNGYEKEIPYVNVIAKRNAVYASGAGLSVC